MKPKKKITKKTTVYKIVKPAYEAIDPMEVLKVLPDKRMFMGNEEITPIEVKNLQQEVSALKNFRIWRIMQETVKQKAIEKGFYESTEWEHTLSGKMMVHNLGILKSIVDVIDRYVPPQPLNKPATVSSPLTKPGR